MILIKILHVFKDYTEFHKNLIKEQRNQGYSNRAFSYTTRHMKNINVDEHFVDFYNSKIKLLRGSIFFRTRIRHVANAFIDKYMDCHDFDILHAHMWFSDGELAYEAKRKWGIPYIIAVRNTDLYGKHYWNISKNRQKGLEILKNASKIIFLSPSYRNQLIEVLPPNIADDIVRKSEIVPNGIDEFWHNNSTINHRNKPNKTIRILTVGSVDDNKNQVTVLKAIEKLASIGYDVEYYIVGRLTDRKLAKKLETSKYVKLIGFKSKEELVEIYKKSDIFILPSIRETFGLVYVEAMSQGLPVIYSEGQGFDGQFNEGEVGFSVDSKNYIDICDKTLKVIDDYENISARGIKASKQFRWANIAQKYQIIYEEVLSQK